MVYSIYISHQIKSSRSQRAEILIFVQGVQLLSDKLISLKIREFFSDDSFVRLFKSLKLCFEFISAYINCNKHSQFRSLTIGVRGDLEIYL